MNALQHPIQNPGAHVPNRITIADVARLAGVSTMTVSRVINAKGDVRQSTRERVERAIAQLEYRPSQAARSLTTRRSFTLGLMIPDITNPFFPAIVRGAEDVAWLEGYAVSLANSVEDLGREHAALEHFEAHRVDGVMVCSPRLSDQKLARLIERHPATVLVNRAAPFPDTASSIEVDDVKGAHLAIAHLANRGRRTIGQLAGPDRASSAQKRRWGSAEALAYHQLEHGDQLIEACEPTEAAGEAAMHTLLTRRRDLDAVLCYNDIVAIGALSALAAAGRRVPEDVAVVGFDDIRLASLVKPALTTLHADTYTLGRRAAELLFERMRGGPAQREMMTPVLVVRDSAP